MKDAAWSATGACATPGGVALTRVQGTGGGLTLRAKVDSMEEASLSLGVHDEQGEANT